MKVSKQTQGKRNRQRGASWELKVRADLESKSWFVSKFQNNVEFKEKETINHYRVQEGKMIPAKRKFNPFSKAMMLSSGFPDFIAFRKLTGKEILDILKNEE